MGHAISEVTRLKISLSHKASPASRAHLQELHISNRGRPMSEETKRKLSKANKGKKRSPEAIEATARAIRGRPFTEEHKRKIGEGNRRRVVTEETKRKISQALTGRRGQTFTQEQRKRMGEGQRKHWTPERGRQISERCRGRIVTEETKAKMRAARVGMHISYEHKKNIGTKSMQLSQNPEWAERTRATLSTPAVRKAIGDALRARWQIPEQRDALLQALYKAWARKPNRLELRFQAVLDELFPDEYIYVGNGGLLIDGKCPDFTNINGQKKLIEVYGDYWHRMDDPQERIDHFAKFGFQTLVLWESEVNSDLAAVIDKLNVFHGC